MATNLEMQTAQRAHLFSLKKLEKLNKGTTVKGLKDMIIGAEAVMPEEDVAYVEKKIAELSE